MNKKKLYLLMKILKELAKTKEGVIRKHLNIKADIVDQIFSFGLEQTISYYKNRLEVAENGDQQTRVKED